VEDSNEKERLQKKRNRKKKKHRSRFPRATKKQKNLESPTQERITWGKGKRGLQNVKTSGEREMDAAKCHKWTQECWRKRDCQAYKRGLQHLTKGPKEKKSGSSPSKGKNLDSGKKTLSLTHYTQRRKSTERKSQKIKPTRCPTTGTKKKHDMQGSKKRRKKGLRERAGNKHAGDELPPTSRQSIMGVRGKNHGPKGGGEGERVGGTERKFSAGDRRPTPALTTGREIQ